MAAKDPYIETEVKIPYPTGAGAARALFEGHGYCEKEPRVLESDQLFDRDGELSQSRRLLRLRRSGERAIVTYKGPGQSKTHKSREEIEFDVSDPDTYTRVLERLGYAPGFRYEKYRTIYNAAGEPGILTIDETPIGVFLELEGPAEWIDRTSSKLGFQTADYVISSYGSLYGEYRRTHPDAPENMIF